jgi:hypothetical protein
VIPRCSLYLFATPHVQKVRFTNLCYFVSQLRDAFFDWILHGYRLLQLRLLSLGLL